VDDGSGQAACTTLYLGAVERKTCGATVTWRRTLAATIATAALAAHHPRLLERQQIL